MTVSGSDGSRIVLRRRRRAPRPRRAANRSGAQVGDRAHQQPAGRAAPDGEAVGRRPALGDEVLGAGDEVGERVALVRGACRRRTSAGPSRRRRGCGRWRTRSRGRAGRGAGWRSRVHARPVPARPRLRVRHRAHPRRGRAGPPVVRRRQAACRSVNTFSDFIACAEHLVARGLDVTATAWSSRGGVAGGLLMGAVANLRPDLFAAVVAEVPFVDCLNTMLDDSLPLTVTEWEEWGDPVDDPSGVRVHARVLPLRQRRGAGLPAMLATAGLNDPRVGYWEPAKWVREAARQHDRRPTRLPEDRDGRGAPGPVRSLRHVEGRGLRVRVHPRLARPRCPRASAERGQEQRVVGEAPRRAQEAERRARPRTSGRTATAGRTCHRRSPASGRAACSASSATASLARSAACSATPGSPASSAAAHPRRPAPRASGRISARAHSTCS